MTAASEPPKHSEPQPNPKHSATWTASDWRGKVIVDCDGHKIGKCLDIYVDVETDEPLFGTVKEGFFNRHITFAPLQDVAVGPNELRVACSAELVQTAPELDRHGQGMSQADESELYRHFGMNHTTIQNESGRRLARR
jgi:hypothetical protein